MIGAQVNNVIVGDGEMHGGMLKAPFPYFGGKRRIADLVWRRFGDVRNYVEPFFGSGAMLLARPMPFVGAETVNDLDSMICNLWRALQQVPEEVARWADWPVNEADLYARHQWLLKHKPGLTQWLRSDPEACDPKAAGWWVWGMSMWIGNGFCDDSNAGEDRVPWMGEGGRGVARHAHLGRSYELHSKRPYLGKSGPGVARGTAEAHSHAPSNKIPDLGRRSRGVMNRPHLWGQGQGVHDTKHRERLYEYFNRLSERLRYVRVCCGDFERVLGPTPTYFHGLTAVFLAPPYCADRTSNIYAEDSKEVSRRARDWAVENGANPLLRVALCGYEKEHEMRDDWEIVAWSTAGGMARIGAGRGMENKVRERVWFSPACLCFDAERVEQLSLFP